MALVSQARSLGKYFLLLDNLLVVLGFFVVFPLISIRFVDQLGWAAVLVGLALGLRQLVQQGLGIFGGAIADRFGAKPMIVTGMLMRAAGFALMAMADEPWILWLACALSGLGGTLFDPPRTALVIKLTRLPLDDARQCGGSHWRIDRQLAAAIRLPFCLLDRRSYLYIGRRLERLAAASLSNLHRTRTNERRPDARAT